jgi:Zincin-like metallopeptidase
MIHASGHISRLNREGITQHTRFGSERYSKEELIGELGAAFLSNDIGILDSLRFKNSAAYLASWTRKLESDPRLIVSAASQAQQASDFIVGIEHKESLQECQIRPNGMPLTWAQEHCVDTGIPASAIATRTAMVFQTCSNGSTARGRPTGFPSRGAISVAMKAKELPSPR